MFRSVNQEASKTKNRKQQSTVVDPGHQHQRRRGVYEQVLMSSYTAGVIKGRDTLQPRLL